ncbi:MFS transporter [Paenibacillus sp. CAA11]|uniref:CynX/NimT family MFS transporter n=1 Tax=Paenibacillus sp. CAA11 TaxID=1532905 RepID=UPI000D33B3DA|nr:MFS transporter [Paenibacillus sp. CAA11]AWB46202.1 MFS transporter [Paenibacillus sp. CAA11]
MRNHTDSNPRKSNRSNVPGWLLVLGVILVATTLRAPITSVGPLADTIGAESGISHTMTGMLTTLPLLAFAFFSPLAPRLARRLGMELTMFFGLILLVAGILLRYLPAVWCLFAGTALLGVAIALNNVLLPGLIKREFPHRVGMMTGIYSFSMNALAAVASGISIPLANNPSLGWRGALVSWVALAVLAVLLWLPQLRIKHIPAEAALHGARKQSLWTAPLAWVITLVMGLQSLTFYVGIAWLPEILQGLGLSAASAGWMLSLMQFASLPFSFILPLIAGRLRSQRGLALGVGLLFIISYAGLLWGSPSLVGLWVVLLGIAGGASFSLVVMLFALRSRTAQQAAELSGMAQSVGYLLAATGPALFGLIHDVTRSWTLPLLALLVTSVLILLFGLKAGKPGYVTSE